MRLVLRTRTYLLEWALHDDFKCTLEVDLTRELEEKSKFSPLHHSRCQNIRHSPVNSSAPVRAWALIYHQLHCRAQEVVHTTTAEELPRSD